MNAPAGPDQTLRHATGRTEIFVGRGALERGGQTLQEWLRDRLLFVVTSAPVEALHGHSIERISAAAGEVVQLRVPDGEAAKTLRVAESLWRDMLERGGSRDSRLLAIGGGSVTDLGGYVAASFLRGVEWALVPTTLLGQVDAAIGGKTAVDLAGAKNSVGAFWHPRAVVSDTGLLSSLPLAEKRAGMAEVVKIAAADDVDLFESLENSLAQAASLETAFLEEIVPAAVAAKVRVVESDPGEGDRRRVLNLGHTLAHAIESSLDYTGLRHGEAVIHGFLFALRLAELRGAGREFTNRCRALLRLLDPPPLPELDPGRLISAMQRDKKARREGLYWVLPMAPGHVEITADFDGETIRLELEAFLADPWR